MPQVTLTFPDEASIPTELKAFKSATGNTVTVWAGDKVAEETNVGLAANRDTILAEKQTAVAAKEQLEKTVADLSKTTTDLRTQIAASAGQPNVTADDIALLEVVRPLNVKPDALKKQIAEGTTALAENTKMKSQLHIGKVAKALNWNENVLADLLSNKEKSDGVEFVIEDATVDGKTVQQVMVNVKDAQGAVTKHRVEDFVKTQSAWSPYMPVLAEKQKGKSWVPQTPANNRQAPGNDTDDIVKKHVADKNAAAAAGVNPLLPNKATPPNAAAGT